MTLFDGFMYLNLWYQETDIFYMGVRRNGQMKLYIKFRVLQTWWCTLQHFLLKRRGKYTHSATRLLWYRQTAGYYVHILKMGIKCRKILMEIRPRAQCSFALMLKMFWLFSINYGGLPNNWNTLWFKLNRIKIEEIFRVIRDILIFFRGAL